MNRIAALKILNPVLFVLGFHQMVSGIVMKVAWSEKIGIIHEWNGYALILVVLIHLILNWNWVKLTYFKAKKKPVA